MAFGSSQEFSKGKWGEGGGTLCQRESTRQIVMSFSLPVAGCLLKRLTNEGHGHPRNHQPRP